MHGEDEDALTWSEMQQRLAAAEKERDELRAELTLLNCSLDAEEFDAADCAIRAQPDWSGSEVIAQGVDVLHRLLDAHARAAEYRNARKEPRHD